MTPKVHCMINGFGRIGRTAFKSAWNDPLIEVTHINDLCAIESLVYLLKYDSVHGIWDHEITTKNNSIIIDGHIVTTSQNRDFKDIDYKGKNIELVMECTGRFCNVEKLQEYLECGVKRVVVSAPVKQKGCKNVVLGCNDREMTEDDQLVTNASCTTNCLAPVVKVMKETFGIKHGCITTIHDVTGTQSIVDTPCASKSDLRRARSGLVNLCPASTGSATAIVEIYPELKGRLNGLAVRVPLLNSSLTDCVFEVETPTTVEEVNAALKAASESGSLKGILGYEENPLVSSDYKGDTRSSIIDALSTQVIDGTMVKIYSWYDNEAGYSKRYAELCNVVASKFIRHVEPAYKYE